MSKSDEAHTWFLRYTTYQRSALECVCRTWGNSTAKGDHHPRCRRLWEGGRVDDLTPQEACDRFGPMWMPPRRRRLIDLKNEVESVGYRAGWGADTEAGRSR